MADELFQLSNGRYITSEEISRKMFYIKSVHPELPYQENSTGYSWDEAGMADLFSECYAQDTRFCPEAKSWYTYDGGKWQKDVGALLVSAKIKEFVRLMALYCGEIADEEKRKQYMAFVAKMGDRRFRDRMMKDAADCARVLGVERGLGCGDNTSTGCGGFHGASFYSSMSASYTVFVTFCNRNICLTSMTRSCIRFLKIIAGNISKMTATIGTFIKMNSYFDFITF